MWPNESTICSRARMRLPVTSSSRRYSSRLIVPPLTARSRQRDMLFCKAPDRGVGTAMQRRDFLVALAGAAAWPVLASAQPYPNRAIRVVVPFIAGGPVDAAARVLVHHLQPRLGQN